MYAVSKTKSWSSVALIATAGACIATGGIASAADHPHGDDDDQKVIVRKLGDGGEWKAKAHSMGSWSDGDVEISTTIEDGEIKVVVNGKVVYEGDISGVADLDLGEIKLHKLGGELAFLKDGHQIMRLGNGAHIVVGENDFDFSDLKHLKLEALEGLKGLEWFGDGENTFNFDSEHLQELIEHAREGANAFHFDSEHLHELIAQAREGDGLKSFMFSPEGNVKFDKEKIQEWIMKAQEGAGAGTSWTFSSNDDEHPDVMLGINIESGDDVKAMLQNLDLDGDEVTVVMKAIEGLPAAKAGIESGDIIIKLDGSKGAGQTMLMELLGEKAPGEEMEIVVLRDGKPHEITIELEAFNPGKLGIAAPKMPSIGRFAPGDNAFFSGEHQQHIAEAAKRLAELAQKLDGASGKNRDKITAELEAMGQKMAEMARDTARFRFDYDFDFGDEDNDGGPHVLHFGDGDNKFNLKMMPQIVIDKLNDGQRGFVIVSPNEDDEDVEFELHADSIELHADSDESDADRVKELEAKIKRLEEILERLSDKDNDGDV